ncbi:MAG TPA: histidine phosphatase family protein [Candidatus Dormibacteraeota bacterium]|nr:histidine phosphatase family protein [Candidatus Dormibacteraeota bacterium]
MPIDLYLVRHGETAWTRSGQHTGRTDLPLLPEGEVQAGRLGRRLAGIRFVAAFSSDLRRTLRTAELAGFPAPSRTPLLREFDYGDYEGLTSQEIWASRPGWQIYEDGCPGGETPAQVYRRALEFIRHLEGLEGPVIAFSHGHFSRALAVAWTDLGIAAAARLALDTASLSVLREGERGRVIQLWNLVP